MARERILIQPGRARTRPTIRPSNAMAADRSPARWPTVRRAAAGLRFGAGHGAVLGAARVTSSVVAGLAGGLALIGLAGAGGYALWPESAGLATLVGFTAAGLMGVSAARQDGATWPLTVVLCAALAALVGSVGVGTAPLANPALAGAGLALLTAVALPAAGLVVLLAYTGTRALSEPPR